MSLFGDGGAVVLGQVPAGYSLLASRLVTHGEHSGFVEVIGGGTRRPLDQHGLKAGHDRFRMRGREVREYVLATLPGLIRSVAEDAGIGVREIDRFFFHQADPRLLGELDRSMGIAPGKVPLTAPLYGNTGAASIPITLWDSHRKRPLQRGERLLFAAGARYYECRKLPMGAAVVQGKWG